MHHRLIRYHLDAPWKIHSELLKLTPNLVEGRIHVFDDDESWPDSGEAITLFRLARLFVSHIEVLNYLRAPALDGLAVEVAVNEGPRLLHLLDPFTTRSLCVLRTLCLEQSPDAPSTAEILRKYPSITRIAIIFDTYDKDDAGFRNPNSFLTHFTIPDPIVGGVVAPHLSEIDLGYKQLDIDYPLYLEMLQSRRKGEHPALRGAALLTDGRTAPDPATLDGLHALRRDGLDLLLLGEEEAERKMNGWTYLKPWS
ncbi:hypothetical protein DFH07DRAFT_793532 [Mycena maculata]|uniref:Uncharacterized protein n=1 Tax=Mycena maculata TaxID=230809 RepID=A0AAD7K7P1_9AGAR|nr:hypothetical protein DFH07DRAFT_793532 [Mycena maculata]